MLQIHRCSATLSLAMRVPLLPAAAPRVVDLEQQGCPAAPHCARIGQHGRLAKPDREASKACVTYSSPELWSAFLRYTGRVLVPAGGSHALMCAGSWRGMGPPPMPCSELLLPWARHARMKTGTRCMRKHRLPRPDGRPPSWMAVVDGVLLQVL